VYASTAGDASPSAFPLGRNRRDLAPAVALGKLCRDLAVGFGEFHDLQISPVAEPGRRNPLTLPMHEARQRDAKRRFSRLCRGLRLCKQITARARQQGLTHRDHDKIRVTSHEPPSRYWVRCIMNRRRAGLTFRDSNVEQGPTQGIDARSELDRLLHFPRTQVQHRDFPAPVPLTYAISPPGRIRISEGFSGTSSERTTFSVCKSTTWR